MFNGATKFNGDVYNWDYTGTIKYLGENTYFLPPNLSSKCFSKVSTGTDLGYRFDGKKNKVTVYQHLICYHCNRRISSIRGLVWLLLISLFITSERTMAITTVNDKINYYLVF